ncbi:MAG: RDD family protein [Deltaproteobacteria bacterium]
MEPLRDSHPTSIVEELEKAEEDHLKNCPNAEFTVRLASIVVDGILSYLAITGTQKLSQAIEVFLLHSSSSPWAHYLSIQTLELLGSKAHLARACIEISFKVFFVYSYFIFSTSFYAGTPGQLLMGLRVLRNNSGKKLKQSEVLFRFVFALFSNLGSLGWSYLVMTLRDDRMTLHDRFTQSTVKKVHGVK